MLAFCPSMRSWYISGLVESPQIILCFPQIHKSPNCENVGCFNSSSMSKSSSSEVSFMNLLISLSSKPVRSKSKSINCKSLKTFSNLSKSHSPVILFKAILSAFSFSSGMSTTTHSTSLSPCAFRIFKR